MNSTAQNHSETSSDNNDYSASAIVIGQTIAAARQEKDYSIKKVSEHIHIRPPYLIAIEEGRLNDLPGTIYVAGFIKAYAKFVDLDGEALLHRLNMAHQFQINQTKTAPILMPIPAEPDFVSKRVFWVSVLISIVLVFAFYQWHQYNKSISLDDNFSEPSEPVTPAETNVLPAETPATITPTTEVQSSSVETPAATIPAETASTPEVAAPSTEVPVAATPAEETQQQPAVIAESAAETPTAAAPAVAPLAAETNVPTVIATPESHTIVSEANTHHPAGVTVVEPE
jgi:cytoskeleton protein RodZ